MFLCNFQVKFDDVFISSGYPNVYIIIKKQNREITAILCLVGFCFFNCLGKDHIKEETL